VKDTSTRVVLSKATVGAVPAGLKLPPVMLIWLVELLTTVLKIVGVVALQIGTARNMAAIRIDRLRTWLSTLESSLFGFQERLPLWMDGVKVGVWPVALSTGLRAAGDSNRTATSGSQ
jgi:hypothetical protein